MLLGFSRKRMFAKASCLVDGVREELWLVRGMMIRYGMVTIIRIW